VDTPLYTIRMEQASSKMHFLPTEKNNFTYTAEQGCTMDVSFQKLPSDAGIFSTSSPDTCYGQITCEGSYTCSQTCYGWTHGGITCLITCNMWTCTPETCLITCGNYTCVAVITCMGTCVETCPATCETCEGQGWTCDATSCQETCSTCDQPTCPDTCWDTCDDPTCPYTCERTCHYTCEKPCIP
jgi:hypothetical protein